jgi:hypothetical protein
VVKDSMVVRVRFRRGPLVSRQSRKNRRLAMLGASSLTMVSISCASLGLWRMGTDLQWAGAFVFSAGLLSHWQVWIGAASLSQYGSFRLARYAKSRHHSLEEDAVEVAQPGENAVANV